MEITDSSKEYVLVDLDLATGFDPEDVTPQLAIVARGTAVVEGDWTSTTYDPVVSSRARLLVGPGSAFGALAVGSYNVWVRIASDTERPVRKAGVLKVVSTS